MSPTDLKNRHAAIPLPAGACTADDWIDVGGDSPLRYFECRRRIIARRDPDDELADIEVYVAGMQRTDGSADPEICVHQLHGNMPIQSVATARELARALMQAADEYDRLASPATTSGRASGSPPPPAAIWCG